MRFAAFGGREEGVEMSDLMLGEVYELNDSGVRVVGTIVIGLGEKGEGYLVREDGRPRCYSVRDFSINLTGTGLRARDPVRILLSEERENIVDKILKREGL